ncbi:MAG TPA: formylmethanofuran dehydrogenase subunit A [Gemmatimonadaceae bacterium]|nr:formylmethanofuran dehydrogenase subunit A [Gemmatimonadaceae bacterium]
MSQLRIIGGNVYDPANDVDGDVRDICVADGHIVDDLPASAPTLDARGMVVMPGGVDIHCHVASGAVNVARRLLPEDHVRHGVTAPQLVDADTIPRSGVGGTVPSTFTTGYRYAGLGYTTVFDAAVAPLMARSAHAQLSDTPIVDGGFFILLGNDEYLFRLIDAGERERAREYAAWMLGAAGAYAIKVVNPAGVELWKRGSRDRTELDSALGSSRVTPRAILETLADAATDLGLPHAVHVHCNNLGLPGNAATTLATMAALDGRRAHFTHLQFHSYGQSPNGSWQSGAREIIEYVNAHPAITADVGQVMFGEATTLTADAPVEYLLHRSSGKKWANVDIELETGCGVVPHDYRDRNAVAALQWAIGLELFLLASDPWRVVLSTDHPNGGSFMSYPALIRLLMDRAFRDEQIRRVEPKLLAGSALSDGLSREYTLREIAIVTRAGPARILGLRNKGQLGVGADADVTIYATNADRAAMFSTPRFVVKGGTLVVEDGELRRAPAGRRLHVRPPFDSAVTRDLRSYFDRYATVRFDNYPVGELADAPAPLIGRAGVR